MYDNYDLWTNDTDINDCLFLGVGSWIICLGQILKW